MKELVQYMARALVEDPDSVEVTEITGEQAAVVELRVGKADIGRVIGRQGRTAKAMRSIVSAAAAKENRRVVLEILE